MRRAPYRHLAAALAALSLGVAACGGDDEPIVGAARHAGRHGHRGRRRGQITKNPDNAAISLKIGSKNFTEQKVLGEIYAQGLAGRGLRHVAPTSTSATRTRRWRRSRAARSTPTRSTPAPR